MRSQTLTSFVIVLSTFASASIPTQHEHGHGHDEVEATPIDHTQLAGVELYDWLGTDGYYTEDFSNDELQKLVAEGLASADPDIVNATIGSLSWYAVHSLTQRDELGNPRFDRGLQSVPGLKQSLIDVWRANKNEDTYPLTEEDFENSVEYRNEQLVPVPTLEFAWSFVPSMLAALFPKDQEVHEVLWDGYDPENPTTMLDWLNRGRFTTEKATKLRLELLNATDDLSPIYAAIGLGFTESADALAALVDRLETDPGDRVLLAHLIDSIVAHGVRAIPHLDLLRKTAQEFDLLPEEGETLVRPEGYGIKADIGIEYRTQQAIRKLEDFVENDSEES
ncbi:MAG: hypothetical protein F4X56_00660 [Gammaproteobacteria bacterium]|nr:hypothetical protein [Gammaproteobacteria bacterium]MYC24410.1 hypothetical protein [Gammaproteobacteria bacterium]